MDIHKITNFNNEYNGREFPAYYTLSKFESKKIHNTIANKLDMPKDHSSLDLVVKIPQTAVQIQGIDAHSDSFDLNIVLSSFLWVLEIDYTGSVSLLNLS